MEEAIIWVQLAGAGAEVILVARNLEKGRDTERFIRERGGRARFSR